MTAIPTTLMTTQQILGSYLYLQYQDDDDLQSFVDSFNSIAQSYLDWFNDTPLAVYTSDNVAGLLLDWVGQGVYGIERPVIGVINTYSIGALNTFPLNSLVLNGAEQFSSGTASPASDDIYKRVLTWWLYRGDGKQISIEWIKRRVSRFLYGVNGGDISYPVDNPPSVAYGRAGIIGALNSFPLNSLPLNGSSTVSLGGFVITVPNTTIGQTFRTLVQNGALALPFQNTFTVAL